MAEEEKRDLEEIVLQRHRKEKKELQAEVQKLKHSFTKGDKKKKKEITEKIAILEADLNAKHENELAELKNEYTPEGADTDVIGIDQLPETLDKLSMNDVQEKSVEITPKQMKPSKAQKRREKKAAQDLEREDRIRSQEIENLTSSRHLEAVKIASNLGQRGLQIHEIPADGNCLYAAICHQLELRKVEGSTPSLRKEVAAYMREHADDFMPFLTEDNGDCYTPEKFQEYCHSLETTPAWGGQLEIQALTNVLRVPLEVVQAEGPSLVTGEQYSGEPLILTYYRHAYGLGEHYNSVEEKVESPEDEFT